MSSQHLLDFLGDTQPFEYNGHQHHSSLVLALKECRKATKRNLQTGAYDAVIPEGYPGNWLGAIGYLTTLDLMGSTFKNTGLSNNLPNGNSIKYAIESFAFEFLDNDKAKLKALVGLRNAFTHDFNLLDVPRDKKSQPHKYAVDWRDNNEVVTLPLKPWDGIIPKKDFTETKDRTLVNLLGLGNMVEEIFRRIKDGISKGAVDIQFDETTIIKKYTFRTF
jgi:hypothetical protein